MFFSHWQLPLLPHLMKEIFSIHTTEIDEKITPRRKKYFGEKELYYCEANKFNITQSQSIITIPYFYQININGLSFTKTNASTSNR